MLSLDHEAAIYRHAFFHRNAALPEPNIIKRKTAAVASHSYMSRVVCYRCGGVGHMSSSCMGDLPSLDRLEEEHEADMQSVITERRESGEFAEDEYGLVAISGKGSRTTKNWASTHFCCNCGRAGHLYKKCQHTPFEQIARRMKQHLAPRSPFSSAEKEEQFMDLWE